MKLKKITTVSIIPTIPFDFDSTIYKPAHFASNDMKWEKGKRWKTMFWRNERLGLIIENKGAVEKPRIRLSIYSNKVLSEEFLDSVVEEIKWRFNMDLDLKSFYEDAKKDKFLEPVIKRLYGMRPMHHGSLYEYLIISILLQNTIVKRSISMMQSLFENYGKLLEYDNQKLWCFWDPKSVATIREEELRALKVGYRAKFIKKISVSFARKEIDELSLRRQSKDKQEDAILSIYGVGPVSLNIIMFEVFNHMDYLNYIPPWEQKIYTKLFFTKDYERQLVSTDAMLKFFDRWAKWKRLAVNYVWEDLWWTRLRRQERKNKNIPWLEKLIRT